MLCDKILFAIIKEEKTYFHCERLWTLFFPPHFVYGAVSVLNMNNSSLKQKNYITMSLICDIMQM